MSAPRESSRRGTPQRQPRGPVTSTPLEQNLPGPSTSEPLETPEIPVSPGLVARENEKQQLSLLNNRLAAYIDHVNTLQAENERLTQSKRRIEEKRTTEITTLKSTFQNEIEALRGLVDEEARIRAEAQAEADNLKKRIERAEAHSATLQAECKKSARRVTDLEKENVDLKAKYENATAQDAERNQQLADLGVVLQGVENKLKAATVENATLRNKLESLKDEIKFVKETHTRELSEARSVLEEEISEISGRAQARADSYLQDKIAEFRKVYEVEKNNIRERHKEELQRTLANYVPADEHARVQSQLKIATQSLTQATSDLDEKRRLLEQERRWNTQQLQQKDQLIQEANERYRNLKREFDDLLNIKDGLQKELDLYRTLLEQEESRLNISSQSLSSRSPTSILSSSSRKRRRLSPAFASTEAEDEIQCVFRSQGPLAIVDHDVVRGKYVILENTSDEDIQLGGWTIAHKSGTFEVSHKFPSRFRIRPKSKITLWSSDSGATHRPPTDILLKDISFPSNESQTGNVEVTTTVRNLENVEIAQRVSTQRRATTTTSGRFNPRVSFAGELFHADGDNTASLDESRCSVM